MEINYVRHFVINADPVEAAKYAGYSDPSTTAVLLGQSPKVQRAISLMLLPKMNALAFMVTDLTEKRLRRAMESDDPEDEIPLKELRGLLSALAERVLPSVSEVTARSDMPRAATAADLDAEIRRLQSLKSNLATVINGTAEDVSDPSDALLSQDLEG